MKAPERFGGGDDLERIELAAHLTDAGVLGGGQDRGARAFSGQSHRLVAAQGLAATATHLELQPAASAKEAGLPEVNTGRDGWERLPAYIRAMERNDEAAFLKFIHGRPSGGSGRPPLNSARTSQGCRECHKPTFSRWSPKVTTK